MNPRILVAGIGNIFFGDDAFGCEVARELSRRPLPENVRVIDFGIRSYDLAYAIMDDYAATILVDAVPRGQAPGTLFLIEPDLDNFASAAMPDGHSMNPVSVLQLVRSLGGEPRGLYLVGCEPAVLEPEEGEMGLSETVQAAVPPAIELIEKLIQDLVGRTENSKNQPPLVEATER
jgi:hydrogenase maturation protease